MKNALGALAGLILVSVLKFGWNVVTVDEVDLDEPQSQAEWLLQDDQFALEEISSGRAADADGWFRDDAHRSFEGDPRQMAEIVDRFGEAGAPNVYMVGIEPLGEYRVSDSIAIELPGSGPEREAMFRLHAEVTMDDSLADVGQQFIVLYFD